MSCILPPSACLLLCVRLRFKKIPSVAENLKTILPKEWKLDSDDQQPTTVEGLMVRIASKSSTRNRRDLLTGRLAEVKRVTADGRLDSYLSLFWCRLHRQRAEGRSHDTIGYRPVDSEINRRLEQPVLPSRRSSHNTHDRSPTSRSTRSLLCVVDGSTFITMGPLPIVTLAFDTAVNCVRVRRAGVSLQPESDALTYISYVRRERVDPDPSSSSSKMALDARFGGTTSTAARSW